MREGVGPKDSIGKLKFHCTSRLARERCKKIEPRTNIRNDVRWIQLVFSPKRHTLLFQPSSRFFENIRNYFSVLRRRLADL